MTQSERRAFLIQTLLEEKSEYETLKIPAGEQEQKILLRSLLNLRMPQPVSKTFLEIQDAYLREETARKGITDFQNLSPVRENIYLWQGDITTLCCDAIVNAANSRLLGCFGPCHACIDNEIHTFAGVQLRLACAALMKRQGREEPAGGAKLTPAFNLPCKYVLHTVGPVITDEVTPKEEALLASCYRSCLELAVQNDIKSIAFCCISTGEFHFPQLRAAEIAIHTVTEFIRRYCGGIKVIFNVFKDSDFELYRQLLSADRTFAG